MATLTSLVFLLAFGAFLVGLVSPRKVLPAVLGQPSRWKVLLLWFPASVIAMEVYDSYDPTAGSSSHQTSAAAAPTSPDTVPAEASAPASQPDAKPRHASLQPDWRAFAAGWNEVSDRDITGVAAQKGVATIDIGNSQALMLTENPDGSLREAAVGLGSSESVDILAFIGNMAALIAGVQPDLGPEQRGEILRGLRLMGDDMDFDFSDEEKVREHHVGTVKYWAALIPGMGLLFGASPAS
jgi:hypothetical protein